MSRGSRSARPPGSRMLRRKSRLVYSEIPLIAIPTCSSTYPSLQRYPRPTPNVTIPFKDIFVLDRYNHSPCTLLYVSYLVVTVPNENRSTHRVVPPTPVASRDKWVTVCDESRLACTCLRRAPIRGCGLSNVASRSFITTTTTWAFAHVYLGPLLPQY